MQLPFFSAANVAQRTSRGDDPARSIYNIALTHLIAFLLGLRSQAQKKGRL
jgi:hypothetical protein